MKKKITILAGVLLLSLLCLFISCDLKEDCYRCGGDGKCTVCRGLADKGTCIACDGEGTIKGATCITCHGTGLCFECKGSCECIECGGSGKVKLQIF